MVVIIVIEHCVDPLKVHWIRCALSLPIVCERLHCRLSHFLTVTLP